jgi:tetratricopeptide (TPR) repeat protein
VTSDSEPTAEQLDLDAQASVFMKRGIALMEDTAADGAAEALSCFDSALEIRRQLPVAQVATFAYGLAACWLNRADALARLGGEARGLEAIAAFDQAIDLLRPLVADADANYARRLAIAWQNRGLLLFGQFPERAIEAIHNLHDAIAVLEGHGGSAIEDQAHLLGAAWVNLANAYRATGRADAAPMARESAERAIAIAAGDEGANARSAEIGLKARHILCQALAERLSQESVNADDVHAATDSVEGALDLVRAWETQGITGFRPLAADLFQFGALVYQRFQPQFLDEFLEEYGVRVEGAQS